MTDTTAAAALRSLQKERDEQWQRANVLAQQNAYHKDRAEAAATALAAKDAELAAMKVSNNKWLAKWERAEARVAELEKALDALDRMSRGVDWCDQDEQARRWSAARRALTGGQENAG